MQPIFNPFLQPVSYRLHAFDGQMAGTHRTMCAGFLIRSFFAFYIHLPQVVIPRLDVSADTTHGLGSAEWDSDTDEENPDRYYQEESPQKRAKADTYEEGDKKPEMETAVYVK